jgi:hypothetical protein
MRRTHPRLDRPGDHPGGAADPRPRPPVATLPGQLQPLWALAVAIAESAAEIAATRPIPSWRAAAYLYAAADQAWGADGAGGPAGWRTDASGSGGEFRFAVLLAEAATARFVAGDGYLSNRQLAADLRSGAAWLATGALLAG